ncbi:hypothetical protein [Streptomyces sp. IMTB 2501]|nr:hypothetical protein [Streptomyces sp. IMTB 2501]
MFPDARVRQAVVQEQRIPVPEGWDDHPCSYLARHLVGFAPTT